ncbi:MAG: putative lipopolysaccharide heptosyltransferase III [Desulfococcaceae bacterium]|jgi:predicted lipopolysaccharide heptosyltransferase III|nr:putative lipopolysaccharide heptosyltransferase III [Desulfococcaceae bacterium]
MNMQTAPLNILLIKMRYIGDVILTTPLLKSLKNGLPGAKIDMLVNLGTESVLDDHPCADRVYAFDYTLAKKKPIRSLRLMAALRQQKYDTVIDLTGNDRSALFTFLSAAPLRIGYAGDRRLRNRLVYHREIDSVLGSIHTVDHHLRAAEILGLPPADIHPCIHVSMQKAERMEKFLSQQGLKADQDFVIIHPGARRPYKSWPRERFAVLGDEIIRKYRIPIILSGSRGDREICAEIAGRMKETPLNLAGKVSLSDLPALIAESRCLIGNDSAPIHIATAVKTPLVALFGPTKWEAWAPRREQDTVLAAEFPCRPCGHSRFQCPLGDQYCMSEIAFDSVRDAVEKIMESGIQG